MASEILFTTGLPVPRPAEFTELGQYRLATRASLLDPSKPEKDSAEGRAFKATDISRLKGQKLTCACNAKLIAVNLRWITYAMKEGNVRAITQNAKESLKLNTLHKATILDLVMLDKGEPGILVCLDEAAHVTVFDLSQSKKIDIEFSPEDAPHRVVAHPIKNTVFMLMHDSHIDVWNLTEVTALSSSQAASNGFTKYQAVSCTTAYSQVAVAESSGTGTAHTGSSSTSAHLRDVTFSVNGSCIIALSDVSVFVYSLASERIGEPDSIALLQNLALMPGPSADVGFHSVHVLGNGPSNGATSEILVLASRKEQGCDLLAYELTVCTAGNSSTSCLGRRLLQSLHIEIPLAAAKDPVLLDVNREPRDTLCMAFRDMVLVMPLALNAGTCSSSAGPSLPFPYVRRILLPDPVHQLTTMLGKSFSNAETALFLFSATNFTREKDQLPGCHVVVHELQPFVIKRMAAELPIEGDDVEADIAEDEGADDATAGSAVADAVDLTIPSARCEPEPELHCRNASEVTEVAEDSNAAEDVVAESGFPAEAHGPPDELATKDADMGSPELSGTDQSEQPKSAAIEVESKLDEACPEAAASGAGNDVDAGGALAAIGDAEAAADGDGYADAEGENGNIDEAEGPQKDAEKKEWSAEPNWGLMKQCAASFVKGLDKRRPEMAERLLNEVAEQLKATVELAGAERDLVEQALAKVHEARDVQAAGERSIGSAVRKATDSWLDASAAATQGVLQKELAKISDGVAASLAQQLSQSRKFSEVLAKGVQRCSGAATKQALEALRPAKAVQDSLSAALMDGLNESLAPVFRTEIRAHFEQELAPLIEKRVGEMMSTLRDKMSEVLGGIASEHEQAAQRLARDIGPVVAQELRDVERILARRSAEAGSAAGGADGISEEQVDELLQSVHTEVIAPLQGRIRDLTAQVRMLREDAKDLERRWSACQLGSGGDLLRAAPGSAAAAAGIGTSAMASEEDEEAQVKEMQRLFRDGKEEEAFVKAMNLQGQAKHTDFLGRVCALAGPPAEWLDADSRDDGCPLSMQVKMLLMLSLAKQLQDRAQPVIFSEAEHAEKVEWINELWFAFDPQDSAVSANSAALCSQLTDVLEKASEGGGRASSDSLRKLKRSVKSAAKLMSR